jgi:hypothetical protein
MTFLGSTFACKILAAHFLFTQPIVGSRSQLFLQLRTTILERLGLFVSPVIIVFGSHTLAGTRKVSFRLKLITRHLEWISSRMMRL